jgi:hypothetical protein
MRPLNVLAVLLVTSGFSMAAHKVQIPPTELRLTIIEEGPINNLRRRTNREPIVQVTDQNHRPVRRGGIF